MRPILFHIPLPAFSIPIYSYGLMLMLSMIVGWFLVLGLAERNGLPRETMSNNFIVTAIAAILGARFLYVLTNLDEFNSFGAMFDPRRGLVAYGGFLGGFLGSFFFLRRYKLSLLTWGDAVAPGLAAGLMITRIGCYLFGCDFGRPLGEQAWPFLKTLGTFPRWSTEILKELGGGSPAWAHHVRERGLAVTAQFSLPVHPTQIYESLVGLGLLIFLLIARRNQKFHGQILFLFIFMYGLCRYLLEILRDDVDRGAIPLSVPAHILLPLGLMFFAIGYAIGFSRSIDNIRIRQLTRVLAFFPVVFMFFSLLPGPAALSNEVQFSTSQFIAIVSAFAASIAYAIFVKKKMALS